MRYWRGNRLGEFTRAQLTRVKEEVELVAAVDAIKPEAQRRLPRMEMPRIKFKLDNLKDKVKKRAAALEARIDRADVATDQAFDKVEGYLDVREAEVRDIEEFVKDVSNGAPDGPLSG